jgi:hypothetical protein
MAMKNVRTWPREITSIKAPTALTGWNSNLGVLDWIILKSPPHWDGLFIDSSMSSHRDDEGIIDIKPLEWMIIIKDINIQDAKDIQAMHWSDPES